jgi:hypothetical protein
MKYKFMQHVAKHLIISDHSRKLRVIKHISLSVWCLLCRDLTTFLASTMSHFSWSSVILSVVGGFAVKYNFVPRIVYGNKK